MSGELLPVVASESLRAAALEPIDPAAMEVARAIVADVRRGGIAAARSHAIRLGDLRDDEPHWFDRSDLERARAQLEPTVEALLSRVAARIRSFATAQRACLQSLQLDLGEVGSGMRGGHVVAAVERAGCYAPGGRYPLPSSILMTAITARVAGVHTVHVASPRPSALTLATAAIAGADGLLAMGGAQALAALVHAKDGIGGADVVVGPGNRFVTAAKKLLAGEVGIDMLAGPSELVVLADDSADPATIAADLIAQAEHDPHARTILIARGAPSLVARVREQLERQLRDLPTAAIARESLAAGAATVVDSTAAMIALCDHLAPEHLQVMLADAKAVAPRLRHYGGLFFGAAGAEVFGDYGLGPNHVLPTGGTARQSGGLSVFTFLRIRTFLELDRVPPGLIEDTAALARLEGLEGHARAAELRRE